MDMTCKPRHALTAEHLMNRDVVTIPRQMLMCEAIRFIHQAGATEAPVVDEDGRYVGMLCSADVVRWVAAGSPQEVVGPVATCPYQVRGRLLSGAEAVVCTLADGTCPFQASQPTTGGRHTDICTRHEPSRLRSPS